MSQEHIGSSPEADRGPAARRPVSRRDFLKMAGTAAAGLTAAGGLGGLLAACGGSQAATTTTAPPSTAGAPGTTNTTAPEAATTTSAGVEQGDEVKAGYVLPITGAMADLGAAAAWLIDWFAGNVWKDGLLMGDGKKHKFTVIARDMLSDSDQASQVAQDLIVNEKVVLIGASAGAANVIPVREVAENFGCPCITYDCPGDAWNADQPDGGFKWCWHTWFVLRDMATNYVAMWDALETNQVAGGLYPDDGDGNAFVNALPLIFQAKGYTYVDPGRYEDGTENYSGIIDQLRKHGVEIVTGVPLPSDYVNFWGQVVQQGFHPKVSTQAKALVFPAGVNALGNLGDGQTAECWFHPTFPYASTVTKMTAQQLCDLWEEGTTEQWTQPLALFGQFEAWTDVMSRCTHPADKTQIVDAITQTKLTTVGGPVDWTVNPEPYSGFYNFSTKPIAAGQWVASAGKWQYDLEIVASVTQTAIKPTAAVKELVYPS